MPDTEQAALEGLPLSQVTTDRKLRFVLYALTRYDTLLDLRPQYPRGEISHKKRISNCIHVTVLKVHSGGVSDAVVVATPGRH